MRTLTFKGFLTQYVRELSHENTNSIYKLVRETSTENPRLYEPLFLYANLTNKTEEFYNAIAREPRFNRDKLLSVRITDDFNSYDELPSEYAKVYDSYLYHRNRTANDNHTKKLMYDRIRSLQESKHITTYKIYTDLSINAGNFNAFIKNEDMTKCSLEVLRSVIVYLDEI